MDRTATATSISRNNAALWRARAVHASSIAVVVGTHLLVFGVFFWPVTWPILALTLASYVIQTFGVTAGYHRLLSHHAFKTTRIFRFVLAWFGCSAMQNGPLWWVSWHRAHHGVSDQPADAHSPVRHGWWHAHLGWVLSGAYDKPNLENVRDLARAPELAFLDRYKWLPTLVTAAACFAFGGPIALVWVFGVATTAAFHGPLLVNSIGHMWGSRRYATRDNSRNNAVLGMLILGEGWHNNHHHAPGLARHGLRWWEIDMTYSALRMLERMRVVSNLRVPSSAMR